MELEFHLKSFDAPLSPPGVLALATFFRYLRGGLKLAGLEQFVYDRTDAVAALFDAPSAERLVEMSYRNVNEKYFRAALWTALASANPPCECPFFPDAFELDAGFLPRLQDSGAVLEYVRQRFAAKCENIAPDIASLEGYWAGDERWIRYFHPANLYRCRNCGRNWLTVLDETKVCYLFQSMTDQEAADYVSTKTWPARARREWLRPYRFLGKIPFDVASEHLHKDAFIDAF